MLCGSAPCGSARSVDLLGPWLCVQVERTEWVLKWPGQLVIAGCQAFWTAEVSEALAQDDLASYVPTLLTQVHQPAHLSLTLCIHCESKKTKPLLFLL